MNYENFEQKSEKDIKRKVSYSLQNVYTIKKIDKVKDKD